jgi:hypothetical protein
MISDQHKFYYCDYDYDYYMYFIIIIYVCIYCCTIFSAFGSSSSSSPRFFLLLSFDPFKGQRGSGFEEPQQLMDTFTDLEELNLFLIQSSQAFRAGKHDGSIAGYGQKQPPKKSKRWELVKSESKFAKV